jgi:NADPH:quinone reductase-like Zn-dependent oxidoreductase
MKALRAHTRGGPEQLRYENAPGPVSPSGSDVCVRVHAAAITFDELTWPDTWERNGVDRTPIIPSHEFAGVVAAVGPDIADLSIGDEVFGVVPFDRDGAAAEYVLVPAANLTRKPGSVADVVAAAAVLPGLTAFEAVDERAQLAAGQRLLIRGGTGAVGSFLTQLAHHNGIQVTVTVRSPDAVRRAEKLGADDVLVGDEATRIPAGTFDAAIDAAGAGTPEWAYRAVRPGGHLITLQEPPDPALADAAGVKAEFFVVEPRAVNLERLAALLATGDIDVAVAQLYPLSEGRTAYASRGRTRAPGKIVLTVG